MSKNLTDILGELSQCLREAGYREAPTLLVNERDDTVVFGLIYSEVGLEGTEAIRSGGVFVCNGVRIKVDR